MAPPSDIVTTAFRSRAWRTAIDALHEATGLVVGVVDVGARTTIHSTSTCAYCDLVSPRPGGQPVTCFDESPDLSSGEMIRTKCRGGLPCYVAPISAGETQCCSVILGGFVSSTRDRKRIFERLLGRGADETEARAVARDIPVLTQREVEALARMVASNAAEAVRHAAESGGWARRLHEMEVFAEAGREFGDIAMSQADVRATALERAMRVVDADSGVLMLRRSLTDILDVCCVRGDVPEHQTGQRVRIGEGVAGRVAKTGRSVLVSADSQDERPGSSRMSISVPLKLDGKMIGVLSVGVSGARHLAGGEVRTLERFSDMVSRFLHNNSAQSEMRRQMNEHMHLSAYSKALGGTSSVDEVVQTTSAVLQEAFDFDVAGLAIMGWGLDEVTVVVSGEVPSNALEVVLGDAVGRDVFAEPFERVSQVASEGTLVPPVDDPGDWTTMAAEVMMRDTLVGYLFISGHQSGMFDGEDRRLLLGLAEYAAAALEKASLFARLRDDYAKTIAALAAALDIGERKGTGHSDRVMDYAVAIGEEIGLAHRDIETLRFAGLLHDVGKLGLSDEILLKPSRLTRIEMEKMRRHAEYGTGIVEQIEFLNALAPVIMHHHERWDGEGYPAGLAGKDIPVLARVLAVADSYDAMIAESAYAEKMAPREARAVLRSAAGSQFDPRMVDALIDSLDAQARAGATGLLAEMPSTEEQLPS